MPKDNEVDEKVKLWHMRTNPITGGVYMATDKPKGDPSYEYVRYDDHAATVAELRAEVVKERERAEKFMWQVRDTCARAEAAERRVGELEKLMAAARRAIGDHHAPNDCYATGPLTGDEFLDLVQCPACAFLEQHEALTGADPT